SGPSWPGLTGPSRRWSTVPTAPSNRAHCPDSGGVAGHRPRLETIARSSVPPMAAVRYDVVDDDFRPTGPCRGADRGRLRQSVEGSAGVVFPALSGILLSSH